MGTFQSFRKAYGALKDSTTVGIAKVNSEYKDLDIAVVKATNHVECPPKERHIRKIFFATSVVRQRADVAYCIHALSKRLSKTKNWIVALKTLIVIHRTLREGDPIFREELLNYSNRERILQISYFKDDTSPLAWDCSAWVRTYALFLEERLECFRILKFDVETEQLTKTSPGGSKVSFPFLLHQAHSRTRLMASHELLEQLPALQQLLYRLIICYPEGAAYSNFLIQYALALVLKESFKIYCAVNDGIINLVDMFFDMSRHDAVKALNIYKRAGQQAENLADFYEYCKGLELARNFQFPTLRQPPPSFLSTMEEYIKEAPQTGSMVKRLEYRESEETPKEEEPSQPPEVEKEPENVEEENEQINLEEEEEEAKPEEELEAPPLISTETDLLGLNEIHPKAAELEESNALALAIVPPGHNPSPSFGSGWDIISGSNTSGWELALVTAPSNNTQPPMESKLAGGFDKLLLDSLYEDDAARRQIQLQNAGYGPGATAMTPSPNPFDQPDPFVMSNNIAAPTNVQIACLAQQQQQLMFEQQQYYQNQQQNMMVVPYGVQQPSYQQHAPIYGTPMVPQQMDSSNPFGDPFPGISQQRPLQPHENHHLL
ncbi:hypothetical protein SAY86_032220 [Trapa natans]|uniref:ENTH domain-containing protein n=1 Tax=Trapa natans TaxID=22666 RepID=A0AAN7R6T1_TRANT|nr:hypothetical protein SAY86_032220 [Trapa natans]